MCLQEAEADWIALLQVVSLDSDFTTGMSILKMQLMSLRFVFLFVVNV